MQIRKGYPNLYLMSHSKCPKLLQSWVAYLSAQDLRPVIWIQMWLHSPIHVGLLTSALIEVLALQPRFADHPRNRPMTLQVSVEYSLKTKLGTAKPDPRLPMIVASCSEHQPNDGKRWIFPTPSKCPAACKRRAVDRRSCSEKLSQSEQWQEHRNHHEPQQGPGQETATPRSPFGGSSSLQARLLTRPPSQGLLFTPLRTRPSPPRAGGLLVSTWGYNGPCGPQNTRLGIHLSSLPLCWETWQMNYIQRWAWIFFSEAKPNKILG